MKDAIVLIHGLMMNSLIMKYLANEFKSSSYEIFCFDYKSNRYSVDTLDSLNLLLHSLQDRNVYVVGHSMGGLVIRNYITCKNYDTSMIKGVVTIATPHNQSISGHALATSMFKMFLGTAGNSGLTTSIPEWTSTIPIGCIAGHATSRWTKNYFLTKTTQIGPNDGTVLIDEAILSNCTDSVIIKGSHTGILFKRSVAKQCLYFMKFRRFKTI